MNGRATCAPNKERNEMAKPVSDLQIVTANRLLDGEVVFLAPDLSWSERVHKAWVARTEEGRAILLAEGDKAVSENHIVGPYLIPVKEEDGMVEPLQHREKMRTLGPSVRRDLGKQAVQNEEEAAELSLAS